MTNQEDVLAAVTDHLEARGVERAKVSLGAELVRDLDLDSLDTMELTLAMEERFSIEIPDQELETLTTVQDAVELIQRRRTVRT
jgi:acyl carrier protein